MRQNVLSLLDDARRRGDAATALAHRRGLRVSRWSYERLAATACQFARELETRRIMKGERVLLWAENSPAWVAAFFGCLLRGVVVVPLDWESTPDFVARVWHQAGAKLLLADHDDDGARYNFGTALPSLRLADLSAIVARHAVAPYPAENISADDIVEIMFTSGTTATPKGVVITHRNLLANIAPLEREIQKYLRWERFVHPIRFLNLVPFSHIFGQFMGIFVPQLIGGEVHLQTALNSSEIVRTTRRERISVIVAVPRLLDTLREHVEREVAAGGRAEAFEESLTRADWWHVARRWWAFREVHRRFGWKFWAFVSGGATLSAETESFWHRLGFAVLQGYGMTETASLISVNHPFKKNRGSIGKLLPGYEVKLDENGEILVRGASISPGYWRGEIQPLTNSEGWLSTGDIGAIDERGNLYFKGRKKDVIVTAAGMNVYPEDLEAAFDRQAEVRASVVVPVEGPHGPEPIAVLILRERDASAAAVVERANGTLARHQQMRRWVVWPERDFPRTATQKIMRREVAAAVRTLLEAERQKPAGGGREAGETISDRPPSMILPLINSLGGSALPAGQVTPTANLTTDLKLDSLGRIELLSALEDRYGIELDEAAFTATTTLGDVEKLIHDGTEEKTAPYPYPEWAQRFPVTWIRLALLYLLVLPLTALLGRVRVEGRQHLRQLGRGPALFVANHITFVDHALILSALIGRHRRRLAIAMDGELLREWRHPPTNAGWWARLRGPAQYAAVVTFFNVFPLPKQSGFRRSFAFAGESMDRGYSVLVFPEGQRTEDGRMNRFKTGIGLLALDLNAPVVPVKIKGLFELKRERRYVAPPGKVSIVFGEPVRFDRSGRAERLAQDLEGRVRDL